ncbi:MAG: hypothetical protein IT429_20355 [Gemmataceae bacterium]|nr:hypothetical protein [Gemmataceae bacterium]
MQPRTIAILVGAILLVAVGLRVFVYDSALLPVSEEVILKQATQVTVKYTLPHQPDPKKGPILKEKPLLVDRAEDLQALLATLTVRRGQYHDDPGMKWPVAGWAAPPPAVVFRMPDGKEITLTFERENYVRSSQNDWGSEVDPRFYEKVRELVSRAEKRPIDLLQQQPGAIKFDGGPLRPGQWPPGVAPPPGAVDPLAPGGVPAPGN